MEEKIYITYSQKCIADNDLDPEWDIYLMGTAGSLFLKGQVISVNQPIGYIENVHTEEVCVLINLGHGMARMTENFTGNVYDGDTALGVIKAKGRISKDQLQDKFYLRGFVEKYLKAQESTEPPAEQAMRFNSGKPKLSILLEAPEALIGITKVLEYGTKKYSRSNWKHGLTYTEVLDSTLQHMLKFMKGEDIDPESGLPHTDCMACNLVFLAEFFHGDYSKFDDRQKGKSNDKP